MKRDLLVGGKLTAEEVNALKEALRIHCRDNFEPQRVADIVRAGVKSFVISKGVKWPDS